MTRVCASATGPVVPATSMSFGKYAGKPLSDLPAGYFAFLADTGLRLTPSLQAGIEAEIARRYAADPTPTALRPRMR